MTLRKYILKDPRNAKTEEVYLYPEQLASPWMRSSTWTLVSKELLRIPILIVPNEYLTAKEEWEMGESTYVNMEYVDYARKVAEETGKQNKHDGRMQQVKEMFSLGTSHLRTCKTMFFTGPKLVYKKSFDNNWVYKNNDTFALENIGFYRSIESLSVKGIGDVFIKGAFECGNSVMEDTQCKITVSVNEPTNGSQRKMPAFVPPKPTAEELKVIRKTNPDFDYAKVKAAYENNS